MLYSNATRVFLWLTKLPNRIPHLLIIHLPLAAIAHQSNILSIETYIVRPDFRWRYALCAWLPPTFGMLDATTASNEAINCTKLQIVMHLRPVQCHLWMRRRSESETEEIRFLLDSTSRLFCSITERVQYTSFVLCILILFLFFKNHQAGVHKKKWSATYN